jgi:hypothetical protein
MSTYYYLRCPACKEIGGFYSRQAWGWGNANIIDTFKFLMAHTQCAYTLNDAKVIVDYGKPVIEIVSEHDEYSEEEERKWQEHRKQLKDIFPRSDDWKFIADFRDIMPPTACEVISEAWLKNETQKDKED